MSRHASSDSMEMSGHRGPLLCVDHYIDSDVYLLYLSKLSFFFYQFVTVFRFFLKTAAGAEQPRNKHRVAAILRLYV